MSRTAAAVATKPSPVPQPTRPAKEASRTGDTVVVACKLPMGIVIHRERKKSRTVPVMGGGMRDEPYFERVDGSEVTIYGNARPRGGDYRTRVVCGYALTQGVPKETWDEWAESHADLPALKNGLIFAYGTTAESVDAARDNKKLRSGLEPLDPKGDPRRPRRINGNIGDITTDKDATHEFEEIDEEA